ncbi:hypothetical protein TIFTF001_015634 [Ficus carica]|uniref:Uncharacterized protein n=1 Tax=Ficus carica TaxID=3494 RepID=A0AA88DIP2_FICCA|nr:hypothetical protein TIFTF001_015634 [Ficus carica]
MCSEMTTFLWGLQLDQEHHDHDQDRIVNKQRPKVDQEIKDRDEIMKEVTIGKGLSDSTENNGICLERLDEFGRDRTPEQAFSEISFKFEGN